ncbi:hypothetical protein R1sor_001529 [Riccia sorocarpa]|uniref:Uncharacterized protein n=1 Tax=Riccia sorocarpa TaxID=122646 RepID=A0ABD3GW74_9MARC
MFGKGKEPAYNGQVEAPVMPRIQLDPGTLQLLQTLKLVLQQERTEELKDKDATKALRIVVRSLGQFEGKNVSKFLRVYKQDMDMIHVPKEKMIQSFTLAVVLEMREHVQEIIDRVGADWNQFAGRMKEEYFLHDSERVTKSSFFEWIERPQKNLSVSELLSEFDRQFLQLTQAYRAMLGVNKTDLFLRAVQPELQEKLEVRLEDKTTENEPLQLHGLMLKSAELKRHMQRNSNSLQHSHNPTRLRIVKRWIKKHRSLQAVMLHKLRTKERDTTFCLSELAEEGSYMVDYTPERKAGTALILRKDWPILARGTRGDGTAAWMLARTDNGIIGFMSIHGPCSPTLRARLWKWIKNLCSSDVWVLGGDWNSVVTQEDSVRPTPVQKGSEQRKWSSLVGTLDLADGWTEAAARAGPHFTRQKQVGDSYQQARLDRFHFSRNENWAEKHVHMLHDDTTMLSDHHLILLSITKKEGNARRKGTYFKACPIILKRPEVRNQLKEIKKSSGTETADARISWELKWSKARRFLKDNQNAQTKRRKEGHEKLQLLQAKLRTGPTGPAYFMLPAPSSKLKTPPPTLGSLSCASKNKWADYRYATEGLSYFTDRTGGFIDAFDVAFRHQKPDRYVPFIVLTRSIWLERNEAVFHSRQKTIPLEYLLKSCEEILSTQMRTKDQTSSSYKLLTDAATSLQIARCRIQVSEADDNNIPQSESEETAIHTGSRKINTDAPLQLDAPRTERENHESTLTRSLRPFFTQPADAPRHSHRTLVPSVSHD